MSGEVLRSARLVTALGEWRLVASERGPCFLALAGEAAEGALGAFLARHFAGARLLDDAAGLAAVCARLEAFARGEPVGFEGELDLRGSGFQRAVWLALRGIPRGRTRSYAELARDLGRPAATRAVGGAAGANPLPVIVPCHRLVGTRGLGGFSGGLALKRALLALEGARPAAIQTRLAF